VSHLGLCSQKGREGQDFNLNFGKDLPVRLEQDGSKFETAQELKLLDSQIS